MDGDLCGLCGEHAKHGRANLCIHCFRDNAAKSAATKVRQGQFPLRFVRGRRAQRVRCPECREVLDRARASYHAWQAHGRAVPAFALDDVFSAVA